MTGMGIVILVVCAIGIYSVLRWVFTQATALSSKYLVKQSSQKTKKQKFIRIGHARELVCFDDLPDANKYKGRTWLGGLPVAADVITPDKHDCSTIIYMDHWFKQYVHDVMTNFSGKWSPQGVAAYFGTPILFLIVGFNPAAVLLVAGLFYIWFFLSLTPRACRATRRMGENAKNFTPETWAKIYDDVAKDLAEEERLVSALRRSGTARWW